MSEPIMLYIHIPFCVKKCDYCDFLSGVYSDEVQARYVMSLLTEIEYYGHMLDHEEVSSIYIGGGTPSWLKERQMTAILNAAYEHFRVWSDAEVTVECNPESIKGEKLLAYKRAGVGRISIGCQSANDDELKLLGRVHNFDDFLRGYDLVRKAGFDNVNIDIMTGLPYQNLNKLSNTVHEILALEPEHISAYSLMIEEGTPFYDKYQFDAVKAHAGMPTEALPSEEMAYGLYKYAINTITAAGYNRYEISNYAKPGYECMHNLGYWRRRPYLGVGLGAASLINEVRQTNVRDMQTYLKEGEIGLSPNPGFVATREELSRNDSIAEFMFLGLRTIRGVSRSAFEQNFGIPMFKVYGELIQSLANQGLMSWQDDRVWLTDLGIDVSNQVLSKFLLS